MKQLYTKTGDSGETSLRGGVRVSKNDLRIEANGEIDTLNSLLGLFAERREEIDKTLETVLKKANEESTEISDKQ